MTENTTEQRKFWSGVSRLSTGELKLIPGLLTTLLLVRILSPSGFGRYAFLMAVSGPVLFLSDFKVNELLVRDVAEYHHHGEFGRVRYLLTRLLLSKIGLTILVIGGTVIIATLLGIQAILLWPFIVYLFIEGFYLFEQSLIKATEGFGVFGALRLLYSTLYFLIVFIWSNIASLAVRDLFLALASISLMLTLIGGIWILRNPATEWLGVDSKPTALFSRYTDFSVPLLFAKVAKLAYGAVPVWILTAVAGYDAAAGWRIIMRLGMVFSAITEPVKNYLYPQISQISNSDQKDRLPSLLNNYYRYIIALATPTMLGGIILREELVNILFTPDYTGITLAVGLGLFVFFINSFGELLRPMLLGTDRTKFFASVRVGATVLLLGSGWLLVFPFGLIGMLISKLLADTVVTLSTILISYQSGKAAAFKLRVNRLLLALIPVGVLPILLKSYVSGWLTLFAVVGGTAVVYFGILLKSQYATSEENELIADWMSRVFGHELGGRLADLLVR